MPKEFSPIRLSIFLRLYLLLIVFAVLAGEARGESEERVKTALRPWAVSDHMIKKTGKAFFPVGIYYVAHHLKDQVRRLRDVRMISGLGFNVIHTPIDSGDGSFLDACADAGVFVIAEFNEDPEVLVERFGDHPALLGWGAFDDVDAQKIPGVPAHSPQDVKKRTAELRRLTPGRLTYISGGFPQRLGQYAGAADIIGLQVYPVPDEPLSAVAHSYLGPLAQQMGAANQLVLANVQLFGWHGVKRLPAGTEVRNMTYQALIGGAKGLLFYTFFDKFTDLRGQPVMRRDVRSLVKELKALKTFFLRDSRCVFRSSDSNIFAAAWTGRQGQLLIAINTVSESAEVTLSGCQVNPGLEPLANAARPVPSNEGLVIRLQPTETAIYVLKQRVR